MHILVFPSFYSEKDTPVSGLFFKNISKILGIYHKVGIVYVEQQSLKFFFKNILRGYFFTKSSIEDGLLTYRFFSLNLFNQYKFGASVWGYFTIKLVKKYIKENGSPDLIHAHNIFNAGYVAKVISDKFDIPYIITEHSSAWFENSITCENMKIAEKIFNSSSCNIAVSEKLRGTIQKSLNNINLKVVPNVVDTQLFSFSNNKKYNKFTFISVGHLYKNKGHVFLIYEFRNFNIVIPESQLYIYGVGPEKSFLENLINSLNLNNSVFLLGNVSPFDLSLSFNKSHCLISSSKLETFGVVLIEAMACGLPVISTKSGGPEEIIKNFNGILIDYGVYGQLTNSMLQIYNNIITYDASIIRNYIIENYSESVISNSMNELLLTIKN